MSAITAPTYDPTSTAQALAEKYIDGAKTQLTAQTTAATATAKALTTLSSAISAFQTSLSSLAGVGKAVLAQSATVSDTTIGSASAKATAAAGSYSLFVQQLATASQVSYSLQDGAAATGSLTLNMGDPADPASATAIGVSLANADTDGDGKVSVREIAAAINHSTDNGGKVSAGVVTVGTETRLVLTSKSTGVAGTISMQTSDDAPASLKSGLGAPTVMTAAQDALMYLGDPAAKDAGGNSTAIPIKQGSNTFTGIDGVSFTATRAQASGAAPITLTVQGDDTTTTSNVQAFVNAYNSLKSAIDGLVSAGDPANNVAAGAFANDSGVRSLQSRLVDMLRPAGGGSLASFGITAARDGTISLDTTRLQKQLATDPSGLDKLIGTASTSNPTGVAGAMNTYLNQWTNATSGQIKTRTDANTKLQTDLTARQTDLDAKYDSAYQRYLKQYSALQTLQSQMQNNSSLFTSLFSSDSSS
jgi:flagellar hook-associated protein 2